MVNQLNEHVAKILAAEDEKPPSTEPADAASPAPRAGTEDIDRMLNWALIHDGSNLCATFMQKCVCASNSSLACGACSNEQGRPLKLSNAFAGISEPDDADDEEAMMAALSLAANKIQKGPKPHQRRAPANKPPPLTKKQVDWIVSQVQAGKIDLPDLKDIDDPTYKMVCARVDIGSAAHVANVAKQFLGAAIQDSLAQNQCVQYVGATGDTTPNMGEAVIRFEPP